MTNNSLPAEPFKDRNWGPLVRWGLLIVFVAPVGAQLIASAFNIWYTIKHVAPLLTPEQLSRYKTAWFIYNLIAYAAAIGMWARSFAPMFRPFNLRLDNKQVAKVSLSRARRRCINLPWRFAAYVGVAWLLSIPTYLIVLATAPGDLHAQLYLHLPISILISAAIALTHGIFVVETLTHRNVFPVLFHNARPADMAGTMPLTLTGRGLMWAISAGVCPLASVLLLMIPSRSQQDLLWFAMPVGIIGIVFGLFTAWMLGRWIAAPLRHLQAAARDVARGDFNTKIDMLRADEFGPLIDEFNHMVDELREKQHIHETFGRHVGQQAAREILNRDPGLGGVEQEMTVLFADIRSFTKWCAKLEAEEVIQTLNELLGEMVGAVEEHDGMVNKFLGDGIMALFGVGDPWADHALQAVRAAESMVQRMSIKSEQFRDDSGEPIRLGIGIHTGRAVVGSIGASDRQEYTAIGDTVNIASRVESLTKELGVSVLITDVTRAHLRESIELRRFPPQAVRGQPRPVIVFCPVWADDSFDEVESRPA